MTPFLHVPTLVHSENLKSGIAINKLKITILFLWISIQVLAQGTIKVIDEGIYTSYFSEEYKEPLYVVYHLYKPKKKCARRGMDFKVTMSSTATDTDYAGTGFDKGHLANAEDFSYSCTDLEKTFRYFNCLPQTTKLNRGIWKTWETKIRREARTKHLTIICGGIFKDKSHTIGKGVVVPNECWKIVQDENGGILHCLIFENDASGRVSVRTVSELMSGLGYKLSY